MRLWRRRFTRFCTPFEMDLSKYIDKITASTGRKWSIPVWKESDEPLRLTAMGTIISTRQTRFRNNTGGSLPGMGKIRARPARTASLNIHQTSRIGMGTPLVGSTRHPPSIVNGGHPCRAREGSGLVCSGTRFPWLQSLVCFHVVSMRDNGSYLPNPPICS